MVKNIRVRFAPSPTGPLHMGGVRTALFNFLFARKHNGRFILRIEDTDQTRYVPGAEEYIMESLRWCGIKFDEGVREGGEYGPYRQSERKDIYRHYADKLILTGHAYYAFDTPESLENLRLQYEKEQKTFTYDASIRKNLDNSLSIGDQEAQRRMDAGESYVIRFMIPENQDIKMYDLIRGDVTVHSSTLDDKVLFKSDGMPTYHLANIVDDHLMEISHVIRGEEWLPSLPLHILLYQAFGWNPPEFAHLPLLLKPTGKGKLSKRDGDQMGFPVFPIEWRSTEGEVYSGYRESGYFPEAFINMLALLGWNPGTDQEFFEMPELIEAFTIERVGKSGSRFDPDKAKWFNHQWLQQKTDCAVTDLFLPVLKKKGIITEYDTIEKIVNLVKERVSFVHELWDQTSYFFEAPETYDEKTIKKRWKPDTASMLLELITVLEHLDDFSSSATEEKVKEWIEEKNLQAGNVLNLFRLCIVGESKGPHLFDITGILGKDETIRRIRDAMDIISSQIKV
jgi:glutamyl-tRNA synthetase